MSTRREEYEKARTQMAHLIRRHTRTRIWFRRTGISSLAAAALWIVMYNFSSDTLVAPRETLAVILGAALMWILFTWAFFLLRKLNVITADIRRLERKMLQFAVDASGPSENAEPS